MDTSSLVTKDIGDDDLPPLQVLSDVVDHLVTKDIGDYDLPPPDSLPDVVPHNCMVVTLPLL